MNRTRSARSYRREADGAVPTRAAHRRSIQSKAKRRNAVRAKKPVGQLSREISLVVHQVAQGFMDSLQTAGEGVLPIVLAIQPDLSTLGIPENDAEFARRERRQTATEERFFRTIEATLRDAMETILDRATLAAMRRRAGKDRNPMAAGGRPHPNGTPDTPRASLR